MAGEVGNSHNEVSGAVWGNVVQARDIVVNLHGDQGDFPQYALDTYLRVVQRAAEEHPVVSRSGLSAAATVPLSDVYVDQVLRSPPERYPGGSSVPASTWPELLDRHRHLVVQGGPGGGKSSLLQRVAHTLAEQHLSGDQPPCIPVRVHARAFRKGLPLADAIREGAVAELGHRLLRDPPKDMFARAAIGTTPWLVLVDGVDEITGIRDQEIAIQAITEGAQHPFLRFVVASRPSQMADLVSAEDSFVSCKLLPFDLHALRRFAERWLERHGLPDAVELSKRLLDHVRRAGIRDWADRPLAATMLCELLARAPDQPLPENSAILYDRYVHKLLMLRGTNAERKAHRDIVLLLEQVAIQRQLGNFEDSMLDTALELVRGTALEPQSGDPDMHARELHDMLCRTGLVVSATGDVEFAHKTLEEYFAARYVVATLSDLPEGKRFRKLQQFINELTAPYADVNIDMSDFFWVSGLPPLLIDLWAARKRGDDSLLPQLVRISGEQSWRLIHQLWSEGRIIGPNVATELANVTADHCMEESYNQLRAASVLLDLGHPEGMGRLLAMAVDADLSDSDRISSMRVVTRSSRPGAAALSFLMSRNDFPNWEFPYSQVDADNLIRMLDDDERSQGLALVLENDHLEDVVRVHAGACATVSEGTPAYRRLLNTGFESSLAGLLGDAFTQDAPEAWSVLWQMVGDSELAPGKRFEAANELHMLEVDAGVSAFRALANDRNLDKHFRMRAIEELAALN